MSHESNDENAAPDAGTDEGRPISNRLLERDRVWCRAIDATQQQIKGRLVCDVEELLRYFNMIERAQKRDAL